MKKRSPRLALAVSLLFFSLSVNADRYYTWIDEEGNVRMTRIADEPADGSGQPASTEPDTAVDTKAADTIVPGDTDEPRKRTEQADARVNQGDAIEPAAVAGEGSRESRIPGSEQEMKPSDVQDKASPEVKFLPPKNQSANGKPVTEISEDSPGMKIAGSKDEASAQKDSETDVVREVESAIMEYDGEAYIDAAELQRRGFERPEEQRFYTVIDSDGNYRNIPYPDSSEIQTSDQLKQLQPLDFEVVARVQHLKPAMPAGKADDYATSLLGLDKADRDIDVVARNCCEGFAEFDSVPLDNGDGNLLEFDEKDHSHEFGTGFSLLRMVDLPEGQETLTLRLRTYANPKVFYPSVLLLDAEYKPVTLIQDIVYVYEPENWFRYGYLEGYFRADLSKARHLVIYTTRSDVKKRTVIEGLESAPIILNHAGQGILQLSNVGS